MSRVHDALRRAEQAGVLNLESGNAPAAPPPVLDHQGPARATENGAARVAVEDFAPGGLHPVILENVPEVAFQPAPESHLLDLQRSHETPDRRMGRREWLSRTSRLVDCTRSSWKMCRKLPSNPRRSRTCSICNVRMKPRRRNSGLCAHV